MITFSVGLEMFCFPVVKRSFCFAYVKFVDNFRQLRTVQAVFVLKCGGFDAACVLKNDLGVDKRVEVVYT